MAPTTLTRTPPSRRIEFMGLHLDNLAFDEAVDRIIALARGDRPRFVVTPNVDHIMKFNRNPRLREAYRKASLVLADGMPVVWASRLLGSAVRDKVSGADLFPRVSEAAAEHGLSIYILGGLHGAAEEGARILQRRHPDLRVAGVQCPERGFHLDTKENQQVIEAVRAASPDILFVALGCPKQELWMHDHCEALGVPVSLGVGAAVDFISGKVRRAPTWMQRCGLEWLFRILREPRRLWKRYLLDDTPFLFRVFRLLFLRTFSPRALETKSLEKKS